MPISKESREQLGRALAEAREEAGLTVVQLAQIASPGRVGGLSRYYDAEAGRRMATSETVSHYVAALGRADLHDLRNKILSKRPARITEPTSTEERNGERAGTSLAPTGPGSVTRPTDTGAENGHRPSAPDLSDGALDRPADALPVPEHLPVSLDQPVAEFVRGQPPLPDGAVVRGREAILGAACTLLDEAIAICNEGRSVSVQVVQMNPERTFTRNLGMASEQASRFFPYQLQRLVAAGGSAATSWPPRSCTPSTGGPLSNAS